MQKKGVDYPTQIQLADERFNVPKQVDILLGANIFYDLTRTGRITLRPNKPALIERVLGWIFTGCVPLNESVNHKTFCNHSSNISNEELNESFIKFWKTKELPEIKVLSLEEQMCENCFNETTTRDKDGRFVVRLPFNKNTDLTLGDSKEIALKRFYETESRLQRDQQLKSDYTQFMFEYKQLNHVIQV